MLGPENDSGNWQSISSAPHYVVRMLGWGTTLPGSTQKMYAIMRFDGCWLIETPMSKNKAAKFYPTHWMVLPTPPNNEQVDT